MKRFLTAFTLFSILFYAGCTGEVARVDNEEKPELPGSSSQTLETVRLPLQIVTSIYPLYEIAKTVGGENVVVTNLVPAGSEPHDYEPTPQDLIKMTRADLLVYNGAGIESWSDKIVPELEKNGVKTLNMSDQFQEELLKAQESGHEEDAVAGETTEQHKNENTRDPHFWLDPVLYQKEVQVISQKLVELDPTHQLDYEKNTRDFTQKLQDLHVFYENELKNCQLNSFVTNHAAFGYLANRYHLEMIPISGVSPDAEPSAKTIADLSKVMKQKNIHYVLTESLMSPKIAETLANESGAKTLVLNPLEGLTDEETTQGKSYVSVMEENLENLRTALECKGIE